MLQSVGSQKELDVPATEWQQWGLGTSLVVQWLRLSSQCKGPAKGTGPGQGTRSHMAQPNTLHAAMKIKDPECCN